MTDSTDNHQADGEVTRRDFLYIATGAVGAVGAAAFAWPFIDALLRRRWPRSEASVWIGILGVLLIIGLTLWEAAVEH